MNRRDLITLFLKPGIPGFFYAWKVKHMEKLTTKEKVQIALDRLDELCRMNRIGKNTQLKIGQILRVSHRGQDVL